MDNLLIFDIIHYISRLDEDAWYKMTRISDKFSIYSKSDEGIQEFLKLYNIKHSIEGGYEYRLFGRCHLRHEDDLPARIYKTIKIWYINGIISRDNDLPSIIHDDGSLYWYINGKQDRENDKPACILSSGSLIWFKNGLIHRDGNKPAAISKKYKDWWINGKFFKRDYV